VLQGDFVRDAKVQSGGCNSPTTPASKVI
jgi:hypothetical protein